MLFTKYDAILHPAPRPDPGATMNVLFPRLLLLLMLCLCCSCQAVKSSSSSVMPPAATTESERLGDSLMETGRTEQAMDEYDRALKAGADKGSIAYRKGFAFFNEGQWEKALYMFQEAISLEPKMTIAYEGAAIASFQLGYFQQSSDYFVDVMERAPKHWTSYAFMAGILGAQKNMRGAREMHRKALEIAGKDNFRQVNVVLAETYKRGEELVRSGKYHPGKTAAQPGASQSAQQASADVEKDSVYRSVQTLSPEEKEKIREKFLARMDKSHDGSSATHTQHAPDKTDKTASDVTPADTPAETAKLDFSPLDEDEIQALLRANKTGQINEQRALAVNTAESGQETAEQEMGTESDVSSITPAADPDTTPVTSASTPAGPESTENPFLRDLPTTGFSAMESSFPYSRMAEERAQTLKEKGLDPYVAPVDLGNRGTWYRVLFGPYPTYREAQHMRNSLVNKYGLKDAIVLKHKDK